ncbi:hypothetical protein L6164_006569 [Bauhinia variegata]|uniref:Uncharacterized protein n=1 Tax=Bauhinia variegata TaxID=167791 RepID=A0ACB9PVE0_BAUVA|nr:hypothetical protein L6164_006569 [Bauhinia variegata]
MITVEWTNVGVRVLFKAATDRGLSYYVYIAYSYLTSTLLLLLPFPFILRRSTGLPSKLPVLFRIFLLAAIDVVAALCGYRGLWYSSPTVASAASNLVPAFTFILAVFFRMETVDLRSSISQAKIMGSVVSISGALIVVLFKGPVILSPPSSSSPTLMNSQLSSTSHTNWVLGGSLLAIEYMLVSVWYIVQTQILKQYPEELIVVMLYNLCATLISGPVCFLAESKLGAWILRPDITMVSVIYAGIFSSGFSVLVHSFCIRLKGPVYVSVFRPLSIAIAAASSAIFLGEALYLGSVVGAIILSIGFYAVLWGKGKEGQLEVNEGNTIICVRTPSSNSETPLLQSYQVEGNRETMALGGKS